MKRIIYTLIISWLAVSLCRSTAFAQQETDTLSLDEVVLKALKNNNLIRACKLKEEEKGETASDKMEWTPSVVISYRPFKKIGLNFRAFYKRIFRMPTLNDLYYTFVGNAYLDPEYTNQYNVGATYEKEFADLWIKRIELQADVYYNEVKNKIVATPTSNFFRWTMVNLGEVEIRGIDFALQTDWKFGREVFLSGRLNYTYQKAQDFTDPTDEFYGGQIPYIPWHSGSAALNLNWRSWEANYSFVYTGERYSSQANLPVNYQPSWYTSDFSVAKRQQIRRLKGKYIFQSGAPFYCRYAKTWYFTAERDNF